MTHDESTATTLQCGRDLLELADQVADGRPSGDDAAHQAECPYCQEALGRLQAATDHLRELAGEDVAVPRGLTRRVLAQLRRERGRVPISNTATGIDTASDLVVLQIARRAARSVAGVVQCSIALQPATDDGDLSLTVRLTAEFGRELPELSELVRRQVAADLLDMTGLGVGPILVEIDDIELSE